MGNEGSIGWATCLQSPENVNHDATNPQSILPQPRLNYRYILQPR